MVAGVGTNGGGVFYSTDGINFNQLSSGGAMNWNNYTYAYKIKWCSGNVFMFLTSLTGGGFSGWFTGTTVNSNNGSINAWGMFNGYIGTSNGATNVPAPWDVVRDWTYDSTTDLVVSNSMSSNGYVTAYCQLAHMVTGWNTYNTSQESVSGILAYVRNTPYTQAVNCLYTTNGFSSNYTVCASSLIPGLFIAVGAVRSTAGTVYSNAYGGAPVARAYIGGTNNYSILDSNWTTVLSSYSIFPGNQQNIFCAIVY